MLITLKLREGLPMLRSEGEMRVFEAALRRVHRKHAVRFVHWSVQTNHVHLVMEGEDDVRVQRAVQGLAISLSRRWNRLWGRKGKVFADRYDRQDLEGPRRTRNALKYVFRNYAKHVGCRHVVRARFDDGVVERVPYVDVRYSSALWFTGWVESYIGTRPPDELSPAPRTWLLREGYRRGGGRISAAELSH